MQWPIEIRTKRQCNGLKKYGQKDNAMAYRNTDKKTMQWPIEIRTKRTNNDLLKKTHYTVH
jgi:hypothetical protein